MEMFAKQTNVTLVHVPYIGGGQRAMIDLQAGLRLRSGVCPVKYAARIRGKFKRDPLMPDVPSIFRDAVGLRRLNLDCTLRTGGTPAHVVDRSNVVAGNAMMQLAVQEQLRALGYWPTVNTPDQMRTQVVAAIAKWRPFAAAEWLSLETTATSFVRAQI